MQKIGKAKGERVDNAIKQESEEAEGQGTPESAEHLCT